MKKNSKKIGLFVLSIFAVLLTTVLSACGPKGASVTFSQAEYVFFVNTAEEEVIDFSTLVESTNGVSVQDLTFSFSDSNSPNSLFSASENSATKFVAQHSGRCVVYAMSGANVVGSAKVVVGRPFAAPQDFAINTNDEFSWAFAGEMFDEQSIELAQPSGFVVDGTYTTFAEDDLDAQNGEEKTFHAEPASNSVHLPEAGIYKLKVKAKGHENMYFCESEYSAEQTVYVNFMEESKVVSFEDGVLKWSLDVDEGEETNDVKYQVKIGQWSSDLIDEDPSHINTLDLSAQFEQLSSGTHKISIFAKDSSTAEGHENKKFTRETVVEVTKLAQPSVTYEYSAITGGRIKISAIGAQENRPDKYEIVLTAQNTAQQTITLSASTTSGDTYFDLENVDAGVYSASVKAFKNSDTSSSSAEAGANAQYFFHSDVKNFDKKICKLDTISFEGDGNNTCNAAVVVGTITSNSTAQVATKFLIEGLSQNAQTLNNLGFTIGQSSISPVNIPLPAAGQYAITLSQIPAQSTAAVGADQVWVVNSAKSAPITLTKVGQFSQELSHTYKTVTSQDAPAENKTVSVFTTAVCDYAPAAENYVLYEKTSSSTQSEVDPSKYSVSIEGGNVVVTLVDRIENLFTARENAFAFVLQTKVGDGKLCINSALEKQIDVLPAPTAAEQQPSGTFSWNIVDGASGYDVRVYSISKALYDEKNSLQSTDVDTSRQDVTLVQQQTLQGADKTSITLENAGYYYIEVYALAENCNLNVDCQTPLKSLLLFQQPTELGQIRFGHTDVPFSNFLQQQSGFYLEIENTPNIANFVISVDSKEYGSPVQVFEGEKTVVFLNLDFSTEKQISVQGHSSDDNIFLPTEKISFSIVQHPSVEMQDLIFDANTTTVSLDAAKFADVGGFQIYASNEVLTTTAKGESPKLDISGIEAPFSLKFTLFDQSNPPQNGTLGQKFSLLITSGRKVFLGNTSTITFSRLQSPTMLAFSDGKLGFQTPKAQHEKTDFYVVDIVCTRADKSTQTFSVRFEDEVKVVHNNAVISGFGKASEFVTTSEADENTNISIDVDKILEHIRQNPALELNYNQIASVQFSVWAHCCNADEGVMLISSKPATTAEGKTAVDVERLKMGQVTFDEKSGNLQWDAVVLAEGVTSTTEYDVYLFIENNQSAQSGQSGAGIGGVTDGTSIFTKKAIVSTNSYHVEGEDLAFVEGKTFCFYVVARNPQCMVSNNSNLVSIQKLSSLKALTLSQDATLTFSLGAQQSLASAVEYKTDGEQSSFVAANLQSGVKISESGTYTFVVRGKILEGDLDANGLKNTTYYLDSKEATWNVYDMKNALVAPQNKAVALSGTEISWNAFGGSENLQTLQYVLIFKQTFQGKTNIATFSTSQTSINLADPALADLRASLQGFKEGEILVFVYAKLSPYTVQSGGNIFYAPQTTLADGTTCYNHFLYNGGSEDFSGDTLEKLAAPKNVEIKFVDAEGKEISTLNNNLSAAENATKLKLVFEGEYGSGQAQFALYALAENGDTTTEHFLTNFSATKSESGKYEFTLDLATANLTELLSVEQKQITLKILALSRSDRQAQIPSSAATLTLQRASNLGAVEFVQATDGTAGFVAQTKIHYTDVTTLSGGIVVKISTLQNGESETKITYTLVPFAQNATGQFITFSTDDALRKILSENLSKGGMVKVEAFANNFADVAAGKYILSSLQNAQSQTFVVLAPLSEANISTTEYGFEIASQPNSSYNSVEYIARHNGQTYTIQKDAQGKFLFVFPDDWTDGEYNISIFAASGSVQTENLVQNFVQSAEYQFSYNLKRVGRVESVSLLRDEGTFKQQFSWQDVENSNGFLLQVFENNNGQKGSLIASKIVAKPSASQGIGMAKVDVLDVLLASDDLSAGLGSSSNLASAADQSENADKLFEILSNNNALFFELTTLGKLDGAEDQKLSNSKIFQFSCQILPSNFSQTSFSATFGVLYASGVTGQTYLYRIVDSNGTTLQNWKTVAVENGVAKFDFDTATLAEQSALAQNKPLFLQTIVLGSENATFPQNTSSQPLVLDSVLHGTKADGIEIFKMPDIKNISYQTENVDGITITLPCGEKVFVGLQENALQLSTAQNPKVAALVLENPQSATGENQFKISFMQILDALEKANLSLPQENQTFKLYFWAVEEFSAEVVGTFNLKVPAAAQGKIYLASQAYGFDCGIAETHFSGIVKLDKGDAGFNPLSNHFAVFDNTDEADNIETIGIYAKISSLDENGRKGHITTRFLDKAELSAHSELFDGNFAIDLLSLFTTTGSDGTAHKTFGSVSLDFAKVATKKVVSDEVAGEKTVYLASNWLQATWQDATGKTTNQFIRLENASKIQLQQGNLVWSAMINQNNFYVYFVPKLLQSGGQNLLADNTFTEFSHFETNEKFFNPAAAEVAGNNFYIAVQAMDSSLGKIASDIVFLTNPQNSADTKPFEVYKNQIISALSLQDGKLTLAWQKNDTLADAQNTDFVSVFANQAAGAQEVVQKLLENRFASPASFSLDDLFATDENQLLKVRFRFSPLGGAEGISKSVDVPLANLLASLKEFWNDQNLSAGSTDFDAWLQELVEASNSAKSMLSLQTFANQKHFGVATAGSLFDDFFEKLSAGGWKMEYCLLGNNKTLTSHWKTFEVEGKAQVFVNSAPTIKIVRDTATSQYIQPMKVVITLSSLFEKGDDGEVSQTGTAKSYILRIGNLSFSLNNTSLTLLDADEDKNVKIYECDAAGGQVSGGSGGWDGKHIMFYLNYNAASGQGGSLVSVFQSQLDSLFAEHHSAQTFEIAAVGNNVGFSSKSEVFTFNLLHFEDFAIENGVFTWANAENRPTAVVKKRDVASEESVVTEVNSEPITTSYSLADAGADKYNYVKFVILGGVEGNKIFVDSEILQIKNVYKLNAPTLSNDFGSILINSSANKDYYEFYHSNNTKRTFKVFNNQVEQKDGITFSGTTDSTSYEVGTTALEEDEPEFAYKSTEPQATEFYIQMLGSTAEFEFADDKTDYYLKNLSPLAANGEKAPQVLVDGKQEDAGVAAQSEISTLNAAMLEKIESADIEEGKLVWSEVSANTAAADATLQVPQAQLAYKVSVGQYTNSHTANGVQPQLVGQKAEFLTKLTTFDFENFAQTESAQENTFLQATIQPLALQDLAADAGGSPNGQNAKHLVEAGEGDGFVGGNVQYQDGQTYVLMGNGQVVENIWRLEKVETDSIKVDSGRIVWDYRLTEQLQNEIQSAESGAAQGAAQGSAEGAEQSREANAAQGNARNAEYFEKYFNFVVLDDQGNTIGGEIETAQDDDDSALYHITFKEADGQMKAGTYDISIIVSPTQQLQQLEQAQQAQQDGADTAGEELPAKKWINSLATKQEITKLETIADEYEILSDNLYETLSFEKYFFTDGQPNHKVSANIITATFILQGSGTQKVFKFTAESYKLMILKAAPSQPSSQTPTYSENYVSDYLVVADGESWMFSLKVSNGKDVSSDNTPQKLMNRTTLDGVEIVWNEAEQTFSWKFQHALQGQVDENPTFVVQATYNLGAQASSGTTVTRIYQTQDQFFTPTIITGASGSVRISLRVKINSTSILSAEIESDAHPFTLFQSGDGSSEGTAYVISTPQEFQNIAHRLQKPASLCNFSSKTGADAEGTFSEVNEGERYYFKIADGVKTLDLGAFSGFAVKNNAQGGFEGILDGNGCTISYVCTNVAALAKAVVVDDQASPLAPTEPREDLTYTSGAALFESLAERSQVKNLKIQATFAAQPSAAALAVGNSGAQAGAKENAQNASAQNTGVPESISGRVTANAQNKGLLSKVLAAENQVTISGNSIVAALAVQNSGSVSNVEVTGFASAFKTRSGGNLALLAYGGIVGCNITQNTDNGATISGCKLLCDLQISDFDASTFISVGGIAYTNYGSISNCQVGGASGTSGAGTAGSTGATGSTSGAQNTIQVQVGGLTSRVQVAGIAVANAHSSASISDCKNNCAISVNVADDKMATNMVVVAGGIVVLGQGTVSCPNGSAQTPQVDAKITHQKTGEIYAGTTTSEFSNF